MTDKIVTVDRGRGTWQGPESKAPVCNDGPQLAALGAENNMQEPYISPSGDLIRAAQALVDRWDSPLWGGSSVNLRHTGEYISELRKALIALPAQGQPVVQIHTTDANELRASLRKCVAMLDALVAESGRGYDWGEEDPFRMGEWFEADDLAHIERARSLSALEGAQ